MRTKRLIRCNGVKSSNYCPSCRMASTTVALHLYLDRHAIGRRITGKDGEGRVFQPEYSCTIPKG